MITEKKARAIAQRWVEENGYADLVRVGNCVATSRSFLFELPKIHAEPILGNYPIAINRQTGDVFHPKDAWLEFVKAKFPLGLRIRRWIARRHY